MKTTNTANTAILYAYLPATQTLAQRIAAGQTVTLYSALPKAPWPLIPGFRHVVVTVELDAPDYIPDTTEGRE